METRLGKRDWVPEIFTAAVKWLERILAVFVLAGILIYSIASGVSMAGMQWAATETFYELIYRVLLVVIALELVRMLVVHDLSAVLELLAFVTARKVLKPDLEALDIVLAILAFVALLAAKRYFLTPNSHEDKHSPQHG